MSYVKITNVSIKNIRQRIYKNKIKSKWFQYINIFIIKKIGPNIDKLF
jgi:hypothetical protein